MIIPFTCFDKSEDTFFVALPSAFSRLGSFVVEATLDSLLGILAMVRPLAVAYPLVVAYLPSTVGIDCPFG